HTRSCPFTLPAPPNTYSLSLHDALPICSSSSITGRTSNSLRRNTKKSSRARRNHCSKSSSKPAWNSWKSFCCSDFVLLGSTSLRSEEHTSELQSRENIVCRLLLEQKNIL